MKSIKLPSWTERLLGLDPVAAPPHVLALTPTELRYGGFFAGPQGFAHDADHAMALPAGLFADGPLGGPLRDEPRFRELVAKLVAMAGDGIDRASLVVPDTWFRLTFTEVSELPKKRQPYEQVLRWKLKRLVPFRVEELRIDAVEVTPFPGQEEPRRLLLGFAIETLISQLEAAFDAVGIHLGRIVNCSVAQMASLAETVGDDDLAALVSIQHDAYVLAVFRHGEPLVYRYKAFNDGGVFADSVKRDLRLTASFLRQHFPQAPLRRAFLSAPEELEQQWQQWIAEALEVASEPIDATHLALSRRRVGTLLRDVSPMLGAASLEIR